MLLFIILHPFIIVVINLVLFIISAFVMLYNHQSISVVRISVNAKAAIFTT